SSSASDQEPLAGQPHDHAPETSASATSHHDHEMQMPAMAHDVPESFIDEIIEHATSGTSAQPNSVPQPMFMAGFGKWMFMFHNQIFLNLEQQSGPAGGSKFFSTNWFMPMAQRELGPGYLTLRTMLSLEPGTVTNRFYPELFQQGETAFGRPLVNG